MCDVIQDRRIFNYRISRARRVSENAFGILTNRFRVFLNATALAVEKVEIITYTCILLHNFLLSKKSYIPSKYKNLQLETIESGLCSIRQQDENHSSVTAGEIRDMFTTYFNTIGTVPWQYIARERRNC